MATAASRRFSSFGRKLPVALWAAVAVGMVALSVVLVVSFLDRGDTRREVVAAYLTKVNRAQIGVSSELERIDELYRRFGRTPVALREQQPELDRAHATMRELRSRIAALAPPPEARKLHGLLLELLALQAGFAEEVAGFAHYLPALVAAQAPLEEATARVRRGVDGAATAEEQAKALAAYAVATRGVASRIEQLAAPAVFEGTQRAQVEQLRSIATLATEIAAALEEERPEEAVRLIDRLGRETSAVSVVQAERRAALSYNRRLEEIGRAAAAVQREQDRLDRELR